MARALESSPSAVDMLHRKAEQMGIGVANSQAHLKHVMELQVRFFVVFFRVVYVGSERPRIGTQILLTHLLSACFASRSALFICPFACSLIPIPSFRIFATIDIVGWLKQHFEIKLSEDSMQFIIFSHSLLCPGRRGKEKGLRGAGV